MPDKKKFVSMLIIELDDFFEDLSHLLKADKQKYNKKEISESVYKVNIATLIEAQSGIERIQAYLLKLRLDEFTNLSDLANHIKDEVNNIAKDHATPKMDQRFLNKKIDKILKYLSEDL